MGKLRDFGIEKSIKLDLPPDALFQMPSLTFCGNREFTVEGHSGIIEYTDEVLRISCRRSEICLTGKSIRVSSFSSDCVRATGIFESLAFIGNDSTNT